MTGARELLRNLFTPRHIRSIEGRVRTAAMEIVERVAPKGGIDFVTEVAADLPLIVIAELIGVLSHLSLFLSNDSGPMHLAAALGVPTLAVFGPTDPTETGPLGPRARFVREPVECSPCMLRECPIDHRCMTRVSADSVCQAARELLLSWCEAGWAHANGGEP